MTYSEFMNKILPYAEADYAAFHKKLTTTKYSILGIRVPQMRKIAKEVQNHIEELLSFPNEYYEVVFIKLTVVSLLPYQRFIRYIDDCVALIDNWAHCDSFKAKCIRANREDFLPILDRILNNGGEFYQRYVLVALLNDYVEERYFPVIERYLQKANQELYYVHMAAAWLVAEILVKHYDYGLALLRKNILNASTHNKSIQKAIESYRLTNEQKEYLRSLKINNKKI